ncbi:MAG TPA: thioredoxin [Limnochordia bacterium]|nr:thioredoxin [Limnochordia bacterium]
MAQTVTDQDFAQKTGSGIALVDFWATWCGPCRKLAPTIEELADEFEGKANVLKLDVDANPNTAMKFGVQSIPTLVIFKDGNEVQRLIGVQPKARIAQAIQSAMA